MKNFLVSLVLLQLLLVSCTEDRPNYHPELLSKFRYTLQSPTCNGADLPKAVTALENYLNIGGVIYQKVEADQDNDQIIIEVSGGTHPRIKYTLEYFPMLLNRKNEFRARIALPYSDPSLQSVLQYLNSNYSFGQLVTYTTNPNSAAVGTFQIQSYRNIKQALAQNPNSSIQFAIHPVDANTLSEQYFELYAYRDDPNELGLDNSHLAKVEEQNSTQTGGKEGRITLTEEGKKVFTELTTLASSMSNKGTIVSVLDEVVLSAPRVNTPITGGQYAIPTGESKSMSSTTMIDFLKLSMNPCRFEVVGMMPL